MICPWLNLASLPRMRPDPRIARLCLAGAFVLIVAQLWLLQNAVKDSALSQETPVTFPREWQPDKTVYHPGDLAKFTYPRHSSEGGVLMLLLDSFENVETGASYEGVLLGKVVDRPGTDQMTAVRQIPWTIAPGRYRLVGWVSPQTSRRSKPTGYRSVIFTVQKEGQKL